MLSTCVTTKLRDVPCWNFSYPLSQNSHVVLAHTWMPPKTKHYIKLVGTKFDLGFKQTSY
jgi:hypothetical protein